MSPLRYRLRALARLSLPELVRGSVRGGISSITAVHAGDRPDALADFVAQAQPLGIVAAAALDEDGGGLLTAGVVIAKAAMSPT